MNEPNLDLELSLHRLGHHLVAGIDEAGRGPLAGPVTAAAVILDPTRIPPGIDDSKKLPPCRREALFEAILTHSFVGIANISVARIDEINILQASLLAMRLALSLLPVRPDFAIIDGRDVPKGLGCAGRAVIGGDALCLSIAAASIVAKVTRDRIMLRAHDNFPLYGFSAHKGYGTRAHLEALQMHGPSPLHRMSFAPLKAISQRLIFCPASD